MDNNNLDNSDSAQDQGPWSLPAARVSVVHSKDLLKGRREVWIIHAGETYRLIVTRNNKLILQK